MNENIVDDRGTTQSEARQMLENLHKNGFDGDAGKLALVLGRTEEETVNMLEGKDVIDDDLVMKIRGIAKERGIEIEG